MFLRFLFVVLIVLPFVGCRSVPVTERTQLMLSSSAEEKEAGAKAYAEYKAKYKRSDNAEYNQALERCGEAIAAASGLDLEWEFTVLETPVRNAFCLPGGKVAVYSGMIDAMRNEAELAFIVAHEVGHAVARHYGERTSWQYLRSWCGLFPPEDDLSDAEFGRECEFEADRIGMVLMAKAGYEPEAAIEFWTRFSGEQKKMPSSALTAHPDDADRIEAMNGILPEAEAEYRKTPSKKGLGAVFSSPATDKGNNAP